CAALWQRRKQRFGGDVSDKSILSEWAAAQSTDCRVESPATRVVGCVDLFLRPLLSAVQVHSDFQIVIFLHHRRNQRMNLFSRSQTNSLAYPNHLQSPPP